MTPAAGIVLSAEEVKPKTHALASFWTKNLAMKDPEVRAKAAGLIGSGNSSVGMVLGSIFSTTHLAIPLTAAAIGTHNYYWLAVIWPTWLAGQVAIWRNAPRSILEKAEKHPITVAEIEACLPGARGTLERAYLGLIADALQVNVPSEPARISIRTAIAALGESVAALPAEPPLKGSVATAYQETEKQVVALREVIATYDTSAAAMHSSQWNNEAAEAVRRARLESLAFAGARREIEELELETLLGAPLPQEEQQPVAVPVPAVTQHLTQPTPAPAPQKLQLGKWWQGQG